MRSNLLARQQEWCFQVEPYSSYRPFVIRHADRRLKTVKVDCDKELYRVMSRITTFLRRGVVERRRTGQRHRLLRSRQRDRILNRRLTLPSIAHWVTTVNRPDRHVSSMRFMHRTCGPSRSRCRSTSRRLPVYMSLTSKIFWSTGHQHRDI